MGVALCHEGGIWGHLHPPRPCFGDGVTRQAPLWGWLSTQQRFTAGFCPIPTPPPQYFQKVIPHQFDSCPDKLILKAFQVKYNPKKMKR